MDEGDYPCHFAIFWKRSFANTSVKLANVAINTIRARALEEYDFDLRSFGRHS